MEKIGSDIFNLDDKIIAITGGYSYLGTAMVEALLNFGALVIILGRSKKKCDEAFQGLNQKPNFIELDINNLDTIKNAINNIKFKYGKLDVLINNAISMDSGAKPEEMSDEMFLSGLTGTLLSAFRLIRESLSLLRKGKNASIINISSMYGIVAPDFSIYESAPQYLNPPHYEAAKSGLLQLTRYFASYLGKENIRVNAMSPGPFPSLEVLKNSDFVQALTKRTVLGRVGNPKDLQGAIVWLCSDASLFVTGQNIVIDGGWTII